jgi:thiol:disulfide interchange protein
MQTRSILLATLLASTFAVSASGGDSLESLAAETAFAEISQTKGVVFVDLYADW